MRTVSIGSMVKALDGLRGTNDMTTWEQGFVESVVERSGCGKDTTKLSDKQVETVLAIYESHFA